METTKLNNNKRMLELKTYSLKMNDASISIVKYAIFFACISLFLAIMTNINVIPKNFLTPVNILLLIVCSTIIFYKLYDISRRSKLNFDKYDWKYNDNTKTSTTEISEDTEEDTEEDTTEEDTTEEDTTSSNTLGFGCIESGCCDDGQIYDDDANKCVQNEDSFSGGNNNTVMPFSNDMKFAHI